MGKEQRPMTEQTEQVPGQTINLVILQADGEGRLTALNHPIVRQFSSEYMMIVARALKEVSRGIKVEAQAKAVEEAKKAGAAIDDRYPA